MQRNCVKGTTILHQFHHLYGFDLTKNFVIDAQHGLPLGVVVKLDFHLMFDKAEEMDTSQKFKFSQIG